MARSIPADRFTELVRAATRVFIRQGYRRTQMADVATALGVAKGTLYVYVASKAALFWLCARHGDDPERIPHPDPLPVPTPPEGATLALLVERLARESRLPALTEAAARPRAGDLRAELDAMLRELYRVLRRNRHAIKLVDRCGQDHPELSAALQRETRETTQQRLAAYLTARADDPRLRPAGDPFLRARIVLETLTTWAVHMAWDPVPQPFDAKLAEDEIVAFVLAGLLQDRSGS